MTEYEKIEREIIIENLLKKLKNNEPSRYFVALKYGDGSFEEFLKKLNNYEIDLSLLELDIKSVKDTIIVNEKDSLKKSSNELKNNRNNFNKDFYYQKSNSISSAINKSFTSAKSTDSLKGGRKHSLSRGRKDSKDLRENKEEGKSPIKNEYIEPVKFEKLLRSSKKKLIKYK